MRRRAAVALRHAPTSFTFEKEDSRGMKRPLQMKWRAALAASREAARRRESREKLYSSPKALTICSKNGAVVRLHRASIPGKMPMLEPGAACMADGGVGWCRTQVPVGRARARLAVAESRDVPGGFWDARRDGVPFCRGASMPR